MSFHITLERKRADHRIRDRGDHFKVVGILNLSKTNKHLGHCSAIYHAFARHHLQPQ